MKSDLKEKSELLQTPRFIIACEASDVSNGFNTYVSPSVPLSPSFFKPKSFHIPFGILLLLPSLKSMEEDEEEMESQETHPSTASSLEHLVVHLAGTKTDDIIGNNNSNFSYEYDCYNVPVFSESQYCHSLMETMPLPEPVWSTTEPSVMADPPPPPPPPPSKSDSETPIMDLEWGENENQSSSYSWWLGFLESLDDNKVSGEKLNIVMEDSEMLSHESGFGDAMDQTCCTDEWLMIPTMELETDLGDFGK